ncbi:MAG TPA: cation-transporting P-type ATPase [Desulfitobacteriaceae bacterium]|nr:cation-transporting P-type ATPase [Desulfitobacteriaceae bacterium]
MAIMEKENIKAVTAEIIHGLSIPEVYDTLATRAQGLTKSEAEARLQDYGLNAIEEIKGKPLALKFLSNFTHLMAMLLWVGGLVGFVAQMPELGIAIWMVNLINGVFSFWQEYRAEKATEMLRKLLPFHTSCITGGGRAEHSG